MIIIPPSRPQVQIKNGGVAAYTFTRQTDCWTWTSSDQPHTQTYAGQLLPIAEGGAVTVIDGTRSFTFGNLSRHLESASTRFLVDGVEDDIFHVSLGNKSGTSEIYYIKNVNSGLYLQASGGDDADKGVTQQKFEAGDQGFLWRFIDLGNNVYRIFSVGTGRLLFAESPKSQQSLRVGGQLGPNAVINWYKDGNFFRAVTDMSLVWDVYQNDKDPGGFVQIFSKKGSNNANQQFTLSTHEPS